MPKKRLHYFNHQFLDERDFTAEQEYHVSMRHHHNRALHSHGIAEGLEVEKIGKREVEVRPGSAVDTEGRDIIVETAQTCAVAESVPHQKALVVLKYGQKPSDPHEREGVKGDTRITEFGTVSIVFENQPESFKDCVLLARLHLDPYGIIESVDHSVRKHIRESGELPDGSVIEVKLADDSVTERKLSKEVREKLLGRPREIVIERETPRGPYEIPNGFIEERHLAPALRQKLEREAESAAVRGWLRLPFRPSKMNARQGPHRGDFLEFQSDIGVTYHVGDRPAKGWMSIPIPPGALRVTAARLAGEVRAKLIFELYKHTWNKSDGKCKVDRILYKEAIYADLHEERVEEKYQVLHAELDALSLVVTASGPCDICLVAVHFE